MRTSGIVGRMGTRELDEFPRLCVGLCAASLTGGSGNEWLLKNAVVSSSGDGPDDAWKRAAGALGDGCGGVGGGVASGVCSSLGCRVAVVGVFGSVWFDMHDKSMSRPKVEELGVRTSATGDRTPRFALAFPTLDGKSCRWNDSTGVFTLFPSGAAPPTLPAVLRRDSLE